MRLGEMLITQKLIDERQLKSALDAQLIYGGHLGTCLIELGYVDDESLGRMLAIAHGVAYAPREQVLEPQQDALGAVPKSVIEKHCAVPFRMEDRTVQLAMIEPTNLDRIDELAIVSGHPVCPYVSPEIVIRYAMERHFGIPRKSRYIAVSNALAWKIDGSRPPQEPKRSDPSTARSTSPAPASAPAESSSRSQRNWSASQIEGGGIISFGQQDLNVDWVKRAMEMEGRREERWCSLFDLPLQHNHFDDLEGVYVVWHHGIDPVLSVGHGRIRDELMRIVKDAAVRSKHEEQGLFVTWAAIPAEQRDGVEGYLTKMLNPSIQGERTSVTAIQVNLPQ